MFILVIHWYINRNLPDHFDHVTQASTGESPPPLPFIPKILHSPLHLRFLIIRETADGIDFDTIDGQEDIIASLYDHHGQQVGCQGFLLLFNSLWVYMNSMFNELLQSFSLLLWSFIVSRLPSPLRPCPLMTLEEGQHHHQFSRNSRCQSKLSISAFWNQVFGYLVCLIFLTLFLFVCNSIPCSTIISATPSTRVSGQCSSPPQKKNNNHP